MGSEQRAISVRRLARAARTMERAEFLDALHRPLAVLVGPASLDRASVSVTLGQPDAQLKQLSPADFDRFEAITVPRRSGEIVLGRGEGSDVFIRDASVSKRHASLRLDGEDRLVLTDLRSRNGTFVRGAMVVWGTALFLNPGDQLQFGKRAFKLYDPSALYKTLRRLILTQ